MLGRLVDAVFPAVCVGCGRRGAPVCDTCACTLAPPRGAAPPPAFVDDWFALYEYDGLARELVARIKYRNARAIVPHLARAIADTAARRVWTIDCVTFAPTTNSRRRERGFDHAALLARQSARVMRVPFRALLTRTTDQPQTGRAYADRRDGVGYRAEVAPPPRVLLIDDVATTGATLRAAAAALRCAGAAHVFAATAARTAPPRSRSATRAYTPPR